MREEEARDMTHRERLAEAERQQRGWERERAPKTYALLERCWLLLEGSLDDEAERGIKGLVVALGPVARSGHDVDDSEYWGDFEQQCEDMLSRVERAMGVQ